MQAPPAQRRSRSTDHQDRDRRSPSATTVDHLRLRGRDRRLASGDSARSSTQIAGRRPDRRRDRHRDRPLLRPASSPAASRASQEAARKSRRRQLRNADPGRLLGPARQARPHLQRDAAPPGRARQRPQAVHRQRLARAADADLQPRRLRRAARGRGPEPRGAGRVRAHDARADRAADQADHRPARPLPARRRGDGRCRPAPSTSAPSPARSTREFGAARRPARLAAASCARPSRR